MAAEAAAVEPRRTFSDKMLDGIERVGNKVPHPVLMFLYLIIVIIVLSHILICMGVSVTEQIAVPVPVEMQRDLYEDSTAHAAVQTLDDGYMQEYEIREQTIAIRSLLTVEGIRFIFTSFVTNFQGFGVVAVTFIAMMGAGVAEAAGMMTALIRKLVRSRPAGLITFMIVFVGVLVQRRLGCRLSDPDTAGSGGLSAPSGDIRSPAWRPRFAGVAAMFAVNLIPTPTDAMLTEITNEAIASGGRHTHHDYGQLLLYAWSRPSF